MFSTSASQQQAPVRTSRRKRPESQSISGQPSSKRQRNALTEQTFVPPENTQEKQDALKKAALANFASARDAPMPQREIAVRGKKSRSGDRGIKGDGSIVLTTNDTYTVSKLPALPDRLRADANVRQHGVVYSDSGYALVLTHSHAIVWPYTAHIPSPETFTFSLPELSRHVSDPLPIGTLVSASASSSDPGLVVVIPTTGKITYWESISSAATMDLRLQRNGVHYTINGMHGGELVTQILNAESAGFVLAFSSGRTAYMSVRDGQGRPAISVQFLRGGHASAAGGIFGSLRNALSSSALRGEVAAVRAAKPERVGERNVVIATTKGRIQAWDIHRGGHTSLIAEAEGCEPIVTAIKAQTPNLSGLLLESFEILDFTHTPKPIADSEYESQENNGAHLLLFSCLKSPSRCHYFLVEVVLRRDELNIGMIRPVKSYTSPVNRKATSETRLYLPDPALVAYIVFDRAVVVISMAREANSPDSQLRNESHLLPKTFEDVIDFRDDINIEVMGSGMEEPHAPNGIDDAKSRRHRAKYPATVLLVRGGGVIRIAATNVARLTTDQPQQVTAKSKLEQAVFFAKKEQNLLNFAVRSEIQFSSQEMATAALELSSDILRSKTTYIPSVPASVDQNLKSRLAALRDLAEYLKENGYQLDRVTKWTLLWDAERIAAARAIWERYDACVKAKPAGQKRGLLAEIVEYIHEDYKSEPVAEAGELDRVRHWFINDTWNLEIALPWAYQVIKYAYTDGQKDHSFVMQTLSEADDLVLAALQGAFDFRTSNLDLYGLGDEELEHGILKSNYEDLPEFWTSTAFIVTNLRKQSELAGLMAKEYWSLAPKEGQPDPAIVSKVRLEYPSIIDIMISANTERVRWDLVQDSQQLQMEAEQIVSARNAAQDQHIILLAEALELPDEAIELAEKHKILGTLAYVLQGELNDSKDKLKYAPPGQEEVELWERRLAALRERVDHCFERFGMKWAAALYDFEVGNGAMGDLLDGWPEHQSYLTDFLHSRPQYAKISWINDVVRENDFSNASETLLDLGLKREHDKWSKKIELSLGKLALLTDRKYSNSSGLLVPDGGNLELYAVHSQLGLIKIQDQIHESVLPSVDAAIDEKAELQLALETHGSKALRKQPAFLSFFENSMNRLLRHEALDAPTLIDLLTLMDDNRRPQEQDNFRIQQFFFALQAIFLGVCNKEEQVLLQRIVWRRCMIRDDWSEINNTTHKDDQQVSDQLANSALYLTFRACLKNRLFDKDSNIIPMSPSDVLGAGTDRLPRHFAGLDANQRERFIRDMESEDSALKPLIEKCRLKKWFESALDQANRDFEEILAEETDVGKNMIGAAERLQDIERDIKEKAKTDAERKLHGKPRYQPTKKMNASRMSKFRSSVKEY